MSGAGSPTLTVDGTGLTVAIVAGQWHTAISEGLKAGARRVLEASGATVVEYAVPGSFELPVVSKEIRFPKGNRTRVQVGPFDTLAEADAAADKVRALELEARVAPVP